MSSLKAAGIVASGETLTGNLDFLVIHTVVEIAEGNVDTTAVSAVDNLTKLITVIETGAQPVLVGFSSKEVDLSDAALAAQYGFGTDYAAAATVVNTYRFAIEHTETFGLIDEVGDVTKPLSLAARINGVKVPFVGANAIEAFDLADAAKKNTSVVGYSVL